MSMIELHMLLVMGDGCMNEEDIDEVIKANNFDDVVASLINQDYIMVDSSRHYRLTEKAVDLLNRLRNIGER